jgi:hypothetical protein
MILEIKPQEPNPEDFTDFECLLQEREEWMQDYLLWADYQQDVLQRLTESVLDLDRHQWTLLMGLPRSSSNNMLRVKPRHEVPEVPDETVYASPELARTWVKTTTPEDWNGSENKDKDTDEEIEEQWENVGSRKHFAPQYDGMARILSKTRPLMPADRTTPGWRDYRIALRQWESIRDAVVNHFEVDSGKFDPEGFLLDMKSYAITDPVKEKYRQWLEDSAFCQKEPSCFLARDHIEARCMYSDSDNAPDTEKPKTENTEQ